MSTNPAAVGDLEHLRLLFGVLDKDCDGIITRADLEAASADMGGVLVESDIANMMEGVDGGIDLEGLRKALGERWGKFDDTSDVKDALQVLSAGKGLDVDAGVVRNAVSRSQIEGTSNAAESFVKTNKITAQETFQGEEFVKTLLR